MTIKQNKTQTVIFAVLCLGMVLACVYGAVADLHDSASLYRVLLRFHITYTQFKIISVVGIIFFGFTQVYLIKEIFSKKLIIEICDEYFYDNSSASSFGKIAWSDMERAYMSGPFLNIKLKNPDAYLEKKKGLAKKMLQANSGMGFGDVCISTIRFKKNAQQFLIEFNKRMVIESV